MEPQQYPVQPGGDTQSDAQLSQPDPHQTQFRNPLAAMQPGEQTICEIKRHPIGMLGTYVVSGLILVVLAVLGFIVIPHMAGSDHHGTALGVGGLVFLVLTVLILAFVFIANKVYWGNHWIVTSDSITQISQISLFSRQSSQLSLGNLEDVTVQQNGILQQMFHYGTIRAETAGERSKFVFPFCPSPTHYAQKILAAREVFEQAHHGGKQDPYQPQPYPTQPYQPESPPQAPVQFAPMPMPEMQPPPGPTPPAPDIPQPSPAPQYQVGQAPPVFGSAPPTPFTEPAPQSPPQNNTPQSQPESGNDDMPGPSPDQSSGGFHVNIP